MYVNMCKINNNVVWINFKSYNVCAIMFYILLYIKNIYFDVHSFNYIIPEDM